MTEQTISTTVEEKPQPVAVPESSNAETDAFITQKRDENRKKRGGVQQRIDTLTREAAEAKEEAKRAREAVEQARAAATAPVAAPVAEVAATDTPDPRPSREACASDADFTAKMAQWVVRQQNKITATPAATPAAAPDPKADPNYEIRKAEFNGFLENGKAFIARHPDFNEMLNKAAERGLTMANMAQMAIIRLKAPEVAYYLARPENDSVARRLMAMDELQQVAEVGKIAERLAVNPSDFVSSAGRPGTRLTTGNTRATIPVSEMDPDDYIRQRRQDIKTGIRKR